MASIKGSTTVFSTLGETFMKAGVARRIAWRVEDGFSAQVRKKPAIFQIFLLFTKLRPY